jgi:hypothetical protein
MFITILFQIVNGRSPQLVIAVSVSRLELHHE